MNKHFETNRFFYKRVLLISLPIILQNLISVGVSLLDTAMLMGVSQTALAASSLANQPVFLFSIFTFGLAAGGNVLAAQYFGKRDIGTIRKVMGLSLQPAIILGVLFTLASVLAPEFIMSVYTNDAAMITEGAKYLKIVGFSYLLMGISSVYLNLLRSTENVKVSMLIYLCSFFINGGINYLLIFGKFGFPKMGIEGAAIGTLIARLAEVILVVLYNKFGEEIIRFKWRYIFSFDRVLFVDFFKFSLPVVLNEFLWAFGISAQQMVLGHMGEDTVAAANVVSVLGRLTTVAGFGIANSTSVIVGKSIGQGEVPRARREANSLIVMSVGLGLFSSAVLLLFRVIAPNISTFSAGSVALLSQMLLAYSVYTVFQAFNVTNIVGVLRSGGDVTFGLLTDIITLYIAVGAGFLFRLLGLPPILVYSIMLTDELFKVPLGIWRLVSGKWLKSVTRNWN